ncbi:class I SAM-dependent methyltransferase [Actinacidiphila sp. ITFR-21]|uniref:class I SAM-dependent methyltransferase n=1 Tax=Actinacidiphila sp. ITFR-21 TaxID=3075199 RepID=UPI00288A9337|nr:class I SAM-dependent methyltransferase [Streptomyces sp. ITFR-21]WNI16408.1 class I SAM-dependent methyltransferase [Streptomyces sp. ITFR-21]
MTSPAFYSKVAGQFGGYPDWPPRTTHYPDGDPEEYFDTALTAFGAGGRLLDVGCADGRNLLAVADRFRQVLGIDLSPEMLEAAHRHQREAALAHVAFEVGDASATRLARGSVDVVSSRRGPLCPAEFHRVLTDQGAVVHLGIGEQDVRALKEAFGRGQNYGRWCGVPAAQEDQARLEEAGFSVEHRAFRFDEYFHSADDLRGFLRKVPIFEDFDPVADKEPFDAYVGRARSERGIHLARHWFVLVARKALP